MKNTPKKSKTYAADGKLKQKIGEGKLNPLIIERAQRAIDENKVDFKPLGLEFLQQLENALKDAEKNLDPAKFKEQTQALTRPVMELKANAKIFHYELVGNLAGIMLNFLESIKMLDKDALSIVRGHHDSLKAIISNKMNGDGGEHGATMAKELSDACARYYKKRGG